MLVVVAVVGGVPMTVVDIVHMITMRDRDMTTILAVDVVVTTMLGVTGRFAFVVVVAMGTVQVSIVDIVDVVPMRNGRMAAALTVHMGVIFVRQVCCRHSTPLSRA